eukprot:gene23903-25502_t
MSSYQSAGFSNNLQSLLEAFQFFVERSFTARTESEIDGALFDVNDAPYLQGVKSHAEMERRLRELERGNRHALHGAEQLLHATVGDKAEIVGVLRHGAGELLEDRQTMQ